MAPLLIPLAIILSILASGCAMSPNTARFYSGEPRPSTEVAIVLLHHHLVLDNFNNKPMLRTVSSLENLPGVNVLCLRYHYQGSYSKGISQDCIDIKVTSQPGHVYYVYPSFPTEYQWRPVTVDFSRPEDYAKFHQELLSDIDDGSDIYNRANRYIRGERAHIRFSERGYWE
jgi:hypothetical protein